MRKSRNYVYIQWHVRKLAKATLAASTKNKSWADRLFISQQHSFSPHLQRPISMKANSRRALQLKQRFRFFCVGRDGELSRLVLELPPAVGVPQSPGSSCLVAITHKHYQRRILIFGNIYIHIYAPRRIVKKQTRIHTMQKLKEHKIVSNNRLAHGKSNTNMYNKWLPSAVHRHVVDN